MLTNNFLYFSEKLLHSDLDQRALDALKEFPPDSALGVLATFLESNLKHVSNKSAYLCGVMKTYRLKHRNGGGAGNSGSGSNSALPNGTSNSSASTNGGNASGTSNGGLVAKGPDEDKIKEILNRSGYILNVTTGQSVTAASSILGRKSATTSSQTNSSNSPNSEVAKNSSSNSTLPNNAEKRSAEYHKLIGYGLHETVAARLEEIYKTGKLMNLVSKLF